MNRLKRVKKSNNGNYEKKRKLLMKRQIERREIISRWEKTSSKRRKRCQ